ncbi:hypothetical protein [Halobacteriovorax sp.]|uniref:hypothetical protein n=1 Tax=Halobacteriovorax sp. TaxID=2020862 RepID=UPI00356A073D
MSDEDEIGEKSDMTRIEDLSEFLHQDDPDVDAALSSEDEPPSTSDLPGLDDLDDDEDTLFSIDDNEDEEENDSNEDLFSNQEDVGTETDFNFSNDEDQLEEDDELSFESQEEDNTEGPEEDLPDFGTNEGDDFDTGLDFNNSDDEETETETEFSLSEDGDEDESNDFDSMDDFDSEIDFSDEQEDQGDDNDVHEEEENLFDEPEELFEAPQEEDLPPEPVEIEQTPQTPKYIDKSEKFEDVKSFAKNITYGKISSGGNPPFSIILRNIKFEEDVEDIMIILNEHDLVTPETESAMKQSLEGGSLLISQISEYAAIYLTHKFRRFNLDIQMGLSDELHPSKSYESDSVGLVSKARINQNRNETTRIDKSKVDLEAIIISTTPTLENYKIIEYLGIVSDFVIVDEEELTNDQELSEYHERMAKGHVDDEQKESEQEIDLDLKVTQSAIYNDLSEKLKPICIKKNANAIVGINYQITPLSDGSKYKISCSGSAVWIIDNN